MRKLFLLLLSFVAIKLAAIEIDSVQRNAMIREGQSELCSLIEYNSHVTSTDQKKFLVVIDGNPNGINYTYEKHLDSLNDPLFSPESVDSINAVVTRTFNQFGIELYMIMIRSFNVVIQNPLPAYPTASDVFATKLFNAESNIVALRNEHTSITNAIINSTFSARNHDCIVYSRAAYTGAYAPGKIGVWKLDKMFCHTASPSTYPKLQELRQYFDGRIDNDPSILQSGDQVAYRAIANEFYKSAKYIALKGQILTTLHTDQMSDIFEQFDETVDYRNLTEQERIHALAVFTGWSMLENGLGVEERYACRIIETTDAGQAPDFLTHLSQVSPLNANSNFLGEKYNKSLIVVLIDKIDDVGPPGSGDNYLRLMRGITNVALSNESYVTDHLPETDQQWLDRQFYWDDWRLLSLPPIGSHDYDVTLNANGTVVVEKKIADSILEINHVPITHWSDPYSDVTIDPFDLVVITNRSSLGMIQMAGTQSQQPFLAPAILIKYCDDKAFNSNAVQTTAIALSTIAVLTGPAAISAAIEAGNFALATFEATQFIGGAADITANAVNNPQLQQTVDNFNIVVGIWGIARLGVTGAKYTVDFISGARSNIIKPIPLLNAQEYCAKYDGVLNWSGVDEATKTRLTKLKEVLGKQVVVGNIASTTQFSRAAIDALVGFENEITSLAAAHNLSLAEFIVLEGKSAADLTAAELNIINSIRDAIPHPTATTIMQKAIPKSDIGKYLDGTYTSCRGFVSTAEDAKHLTTFEDIYYGMRLDYSQTPFHLSDGSCGVIRFRAQNSSSAIVPKSPTNGGVETASMPFTGHGFTSGNNGRLGVPELQMSSFASIERGELWEVFSDGQEILRATFDRNLGKFVPTP